MSERKLQRGSLVAREATLTVLYLLTYPLILAGWLRYRSGSSRARGRGGRTTTDLLTNRDLGDLYTSLLTFDFGQSLYFGRPVWDVIVSGIGETITLIATSIVVFGVLASVGFAILRTRTGVLRSAVVGVATVASSLPSAFWFLVVLAFTPGMSTDSALGLFVSGLALSLPLVGFFTRRLDLQRRGGTGRQLSTLREVLGRRTWSVEGWFYVSYFVGAIVVVEALTSTHGLGRSLFQGLVTRDVPLIVGVTLVLVQAAVVLGFARNLAWTLSDRSGGSERGSRGEDDVDTGTHPAAATSPLGNPRLVGGALALFAVCVVGVAGPHLFQRGPPTLTGASAWSISAGLGAILGELAIAWVTAIVVGVPFGVVGARVGSLRFAFRALFDLIMNVPLLVYVMVGVAIGFPAGLFALGVGMIPYVFRITLATYASPTDAARPTGGLAGGLADVLGRTGSYFVVVLFVAMELRILGVVPFRTPLAYPSALLQQGQVADATLMVAVVVGMPALAILLLADGLQSSTTGEYTSQAAEPRS